MGKEAVLIVGDSGFVGMRLARVLTDLKIAVWVVDVEEPAVMTFGSPFKFEKCSMLDKDGLKRVVCSIPELDAIIMVASVGMSGSGMLDPETEVTNVTGTRNVQDRVNNPVVVGVIDNKLLNATQSVAISDGLNFNPGVRVETNCQNC